MNWRKILAVTTAMAAVGAFTPSTVVQKCVSMVFAAEETVVTVQPTSFTYYQSYDGSKTVENDDGTTSNVTVYCASITGFEGEAAGDIVLPDEIDGMPVKEIGWNFRDADLSNVRSITVTKAFRSGIDYVPANVDIIIPEGNENFILKDGVVYSKNISNVRNEKDDGTYEYVEQTTLELERINSNAPKDFVLPTEIDGIPINGISWGADLSALSSLTVPDDFSDIGISRRVDILFSEKHTKFKTYNGFKYYTDKYTKYEYDENGNYKYDENRNRISTEVTYAEIFGFDGSVKGDVVIPDEIDGTKVEGLDIHGSAWKDKVTSVTLPKYLSSLETINIPDTCGIKTKEGSENFEVSGDFLIDKNGDYRYDSEQEKYVPKSKAIKVLKHLTGEVTIPEDIESMSAVFRGNPDITVINIPASLTYMDKYFCSDMPSLTAFNVDKDNPYYFSVNGALCRRYTWNEFVGYDEETGGPRYENVEHRDLIALPEGYEGEFTTDDDIKLTVCGLAFENCKKVTSVKLGKGTDLDWQFNGFIGCDSLADIELNGSLSYFEKSWIDTTKWYKEAPDGVLYSGTTAVAYKGSETPAEVTIKDGTKQIPWYFVCKGAISELNIPASVEVIGEYVLDHETISAVNVDPANKVYASEDGVLFSKDMKTLKFYPQAKTDSSYTIPDGTELIAAYAFAGNTYLKHVEIPESVEIIYGTIWGGAFEGCTSLEEIKVPSKVKDMDWGELTDCNLKVLDLPETMACYTGHYGLNQWRPGSEVQKWENGGCGAKVERTIFRNAECEISGVKDTIIVGYKDSTAETYAKENNLTFELLDDYDKAQETATTTTTAQPTTTTTSSAEQTATTTTTTAQPKTTTTAQPTTTTTAQPTTTTAQPTTTTIVQTTTSTTTTTTQPAVTTTTSAATQPVTTTSAAASTTAKPTTTTTTATTQSATASNATTTASEATTTTTTQTTTASASTSEPVTTTATDTTPDGPDMSDFYGNWLVYGAAIKGIPRDVTSDEIYQFVISPNKTGRAVLESKSFDFTWVPAADGKKLTITKPDGSTFDLAHDGTDLIFYVSEGKALYLRKGEIPVDLGDPNHDGKVDANDASFVLVQYAKLSTGGEALLTENEKYAADVNKDGKIDAKDASIVLAYYSYLSTGGDEAFDVYLEKQKK